MYKRYEVYFKKKNVNGKKVRGLTEPLSLKTGEFFLVYPLGQDNDTVLQTCGDKPKGLRNSYFLIQQ